MKKSHSGKPKKVVFDLDGIICTQTDGDYSQAKPISEAIKIVNRLHKSGYFIVIHTARFMNRNNGNAEKACKEGYDFTKRQIDSWGVKYHQLIFGKPSAEVIVDDRAVFFKPNWTLIEKHVRTKLKHKNAGGH